MSRYPKKSRLFGILAGVILAVGLVMATPGQAQAASSYQLPCFPYPPQDFYYGQYVSGWGYHVADDVCHQAGSQVYAVADGVVVYSAKTPDSYRWGNLIIIEHRNADGSTVISLYGHLNSDRRVGAGQSVVKGQTIGSVGPRGSVNGNWDPHLHFGIHAGGYGAPIGSYATWVHGYEYNFPSGWLNPTPYAMGRRSQIDAVQITAHGMGQMYNNGTPTVSLYWRNTGSATWLKDGANPMRAGTIGPYNRGSPFAAGGESPGWVGTNRLEMVSDTPHGELAEFRATFTSPRIAGNYRECFAPVAEGITWLETRPICIDFSVLPPMHRFGYVSHVFTENFDDPTDFSNPVNNDPMLPGEQRNVKLVLKNVGELPWDKAGTNPVRMTTTRPADRTSAWQTSGNGSIDPSENWLAYNRPTGIEARYNNNGTVDPSDPQITEGESAVFSFTLTAPQTGGVFNEYFGMAVEGVTHMPDIGMFLPMSVPLPGHHYSYVSHTLTPNSVGAATREQDLVVRLRNIGREPWTVGGTVRLGTDQPRDGASVFHTASGSESWISPTRLSAVDANVSSPGKNTIDFNEIAEFRAKLTIPTNLAPGLHRLYFQPVAEGVTWFPENLGMWAGINITAPQYGLKVEHVSYTGGNPNAMTPGSTVTARLAIRNLGRVPWPVSGSNAVRLGTEHPKDRTSLFQEDGGADPWLAYNRPSAIDGRVTDLGTLATTTDTAIDGDEIAWVTVPLKAPNQAGTKNEYVGLVHEGVTWLPDIGMYFPLTVTTEGSAAAQPATTPTPVVPTATPTPVSADFAAWRFLASLHAPLIALR